jgi:tetratricopeptide (TPR) repeat protein
MKPTICLNMIVRDEASVVEATLDSVAPHLDYWVVVDTGSTDDTVEMIRSYFDAIGVPGEIHERPWRDFGQNRTEALALCRGKADYSWVIDADDIVFGELDLSTLTADSYLLRHGADFRYWRKQIFRTALPWRFEGVVHEYPVCAEPCTEARLDGDYHIDSRRLGARNRAPDKYERDARRLREAVEKHPDEPRWVFYLAQSCLDAGDHREALRWYSRRAEMGGWGEEVFYSLLKRAGCLLALGESWESAVDAYLPAWEARPTRAEPLYEIARLHRVHGDSRLGYEFAQRACAIPFPDEDVLFVAADIYTWRGADELAYCAYRVGRHAESQELWSRLLESGELPAGERERVVQNRDFTAARIEAEAKGPRPRAAALTLDRTRT